LASWAPQILPLAQLPQSSVPSQPSLISPQSLSGGHARSGGQPMGHSEHRYTPLQPSDAVPQATVAQARLFSRGTQRGQGQSSTWPQPSEIEEQITPSAWQVVGTQLGVTHWF